MQIGGERLLTVPPNMGYGKKKLDSIPANSTLIFGKCNLVQSAGTVVSCASTEVKLLKIN